MVEGEDGEVIANDAYQEKMLDVLRKYTAAKKNNKLLVLPFTTITDYLWELKEIAMLMGPLGPRALFYLAAAVSDFFVPKDRMEEHKIQSSEVGGQKSNESASSTPAANPATVTQGKKLIIDLDPVPKFLKALVDEWAPQGMIVSFKLETDPSLLVAKSQMALDRYRHHLVIGNLLSTRKWEVVFVAPNTEEQWIEVPQHRRIKSVSGSSGLLGRPDVTAASVAEILRRNSIAAMPDLEIESLIVPEVVKMQGMHIRRSQNEGSRN